MPRLIGESFVEVTKEDVHEMRQLLTDPGFIWAVGTDAIPKFAALFYYADTQIEIAGDIQATGPV